MWAGFTAGMVGTGKVPCSRKATAVSACVIVFRVHSLCQEWSCLRAGYMAFLGLAAVHMLGCAFAASGATCDTLACQHVLAHPFLCVGKS